ncbi:hypothetical protein ACIA5D_20810 [Actinoplanes sp. NPDC051513]|uniref:hypothetical protein n=1 Tax=Actinoplanes sp. NPDC051513 TaxID=3363908 RepID=UPI0037BD8FDD
MRLGEIIEATKDRDGELGMGRGHDDGIYVSARQRRRRRRRIGTTVAAVGLTLGAIAYGGTTWYLGRGSTVALEPAPSPATPTPATPTPATPVPTPNEPQTVPGSGPPPGTISAARRSWLPSPVPSPSGLTDDELAASQVSRLLEPNPGGVAAADIGATVRNEVGPDGSQLRIVSARFDLTPRWKLLGVADAGLPVGAARCTQNFRAEGSAVPESRPGLLLCWRTSPFKSIVVVATRAAGRPDPAVGGVVISREWASMG